MTTARALHHIDLWVDDAATAAGEWGWLLGELGWEVELPEQSWVHPDGTYLFLERSCDQAEGGHDRLRPGVNHLAFVIPHEDGEVLGGRALLDRLRAESSAHGWHELFADRYPHAGGEQHVALYLESSEGFEVELVV